MALAQPHVEDLRVMAVWDGAVHHSVEIDILLTITVLPNSRLRLISNEVMVQADLTSLSQQATGHVDQGQEHQESNGSLSEVGLDHDLPVEGSPISHTISSSEATGIRYGRPSSLDSRLVHPRTKMPRPTRNFATPPRKRPVSMSKRPPWRSPGREDMVRRGGGLPGTAVAKRRISRSADAALSLPKVRAEKLKAPQKEDRKYSVEKWLQENHPISKDETIVPYGTPPFDSLDQQSLQRPCLGNHHALAPQATAASLTELPSSRSSSSRAAIPWTSIRNQNPLLLRGGGSACDIPCQSITSLETRDGFVYIVFENDAPVGSILSVKVQARVRLLEDAQKGGHILEVPGLPIQNDRSKGQFRLKLTGDEYTGKVAYISEEFGETRLDKSSGSFQLTLAFALAAPLSVKLLCYEKVRQLKPSDFEIEYHVRTSFDFINAGDSTDDTLEVTYTLLSSLRLHDFLLWADTVEFTIFLIGGPSGTLKADLSPANRRLWLNGYQCRAGHEMEMTLATKVEDIPKSFSLIFDKNLGAAPFELWMPTLSKLSRPSGGMAIERDDAEFGLVYAVDPEECPGGTRRRSANGLGLCKSGPRSFSFFAQEQFLRKVKGEGLLWLPENQWSPRKLAGKINRQSSGFLNESGVNSDRDGCSDLEGDASSAPDENRKNGAATAKDKAKDLFLEVNSKHSERRGRYRFGRFLLGLMLAYLLAYRFATNAVLDFEIAARQKLGTEIRDSLDFLDLEAVPRYDDVTGWKHLWKRTCCGGQTGSAFAGNKDGAVGPGTGAKSDAGKGPKIYEVVRRGGEESGEEVSEENQTRQATEADEQRPEENVVAIRSRGVVTEASERPPGGPVSFRDKLDWMLGWKGPNGDW